MVVTSSVCWLINNAKGKFQLLISAAFCIFHKCLFELNKNETLLRWLVSSLIFVWQALFFCCIMKIWAILIRCANCVLISRQQLKSINIITLHVVWKFDIFAPTPPSHFSLYVWCCVLPAFLLTFLLLSFFALITRAWSTFNGFFSVAFSFLPYISTGNPHYTYFISSIKYLFIRVHARLTLEWFSCVYVLPIVDPSSCNWLPSSKAISALARRELSALLRCSCVIMNFRLTLIMLNEIIRVLFINVH